MTTADGGVDEVTCGMKTISFESLVSGSAGVRVTDDVPPKIWAVELVMAVKGCTRCNAARDLGAIPDTLFDTHQKLSLKKLSGNGKWPVKLVTFEHAIELIMVLPGPAAKAFRLQACDILKRFFAGDQTLHAEVDYNASIGLVAACEAFLSDALVSAKRKREVDPEIGYVYGSVSEAFPNLIKIGYTHNLDSRLCSMNTSCAPLPHRFVAVAPTYYPARDERMAHAYFADRHEVKEFYHVTAEELQAFFNRYSAPEYYEVIKKQ